MPGKGKPFQKGDPRAGRPKGCKAKCPPDMKAWARAFVESDAWRASAEARMLKGKAPHLEGHFVGVFVPKPKEGMLHEGTIDVVKTIIHKHVTG